MNADVSHEEIVLATFHPDTNDFGACRTEVDILDKRGNHINFKFPVNIKKQPHNGKKPSQN